MNRIILTASILTGLLVSLSSPCFAGWLFYHKPPFKGKIVDAETKEPIEGVVVVAIYRKTPFISGPAGGSSSIIHIREALTDAKGEFSIPSYGTLISPISKEHVTDFIIYKPGYGSYPTRKVYPFEYCGPEFLFSKEPGLKGELRQGSKTIPITYGLVELPKLKSWEERRKSLPGYPSEISSKDAPHFFNAINEERKRLGIHGEVGKRER